MMRGGSQASSSRAWRSRPLQGQHAVAHVAQCVGRRLPEVVEVVGQTGRVLAHRLEGHDAQAVSTALLSEEPEVLFAVGRDLAQDGDPLVSVPGEPRCAQRGVGSAVAVSEPEAVLAAELLGAGPADERDMQLVGQRGDDHGVVGAVGTGDADAPLVDEVAEPVHGIAGRTGGQPVFGVDDELDRTVEISLLDGLVERHLMDLVVAAAGAVEGGAEPADLDGLRVSGPFVPGGLHGELLVTGADGVGAAMRRAFANGSDMADADRGPTRHYENSAMIPA